MQIVIDIPNWLYNAIMEYKEPHYSKSLGEAVRDGIPLSKGHQGRGMKRTYDAERFEGKCPYTDKPCNEWECDTCEIEAEEKKSMEELDRAESEEQA